MPAAWKDKDSLCGEGQCQGLRLHRLPLNLWPGLSDCPHSRLSPMATSTGPGPILPHGGAPAHCPTRPRQVASPEQRREAPHPPGAVLEHLPSPARHVPREPSCGYTPCLLTVTFHLPKVGSLLSRHLREVMGRENPRKSSFEIFWGCSRLDLNEG